MKKFITLAISVFALMFFSSSCQQEENPSPTQGNVTFSLSHKTRSNGREKETTTPAFVLLNIKDSKGNAQENIKLSLYDLGQGHVSENLELQTGNYLLTQFAILDVTNKIIYATPMEGSDLAEYVTDPLPMEFIVNNEGTQVIPQVLAVLEDDRPESFGFTNFSFEIVGQKDKVRKIVFTEWIDKWIGAVTTMHFQYRNGKIQSIDGNLFFEQNSPNSEERFYLPNGDLSSLNGSGWLGGDKWNLSHEYKNGLRYKTSFERNGTTFITTFTEYDGTRPVRIENFYGGLYRSHSLAQLTVLTFDLTGNLTSQKNTDIPGHSSAVEEKTTTYGTELNPLRNLLETPLPTALGYYDDLAFYFSTHLPSTAESNRPYIDPIHNRIIFQYEKDIRGRVIEVRALPPDLSSPRYTLDITYCE
jgi:hypothetical protein